MMSNKRKYRKEPMVEVNIGDSEKGKKFTGYTDAFAFANGLLKLPQVDDVKIRKIKPTDQKAA